MPGQHGVESKKRTSQGHSRLTPNTPALLSDTTGLTGRTVLEGTEKALTQPPSLSCLGAHIGTPAKIKDDRFL